MLALEHPGAEMLRGMRRTRPNLPYERRSRKCSTSPLGSLFGHWPARRLQSKGNFDSPLAASKTDPVGLWVFAVGLNRLA